MSEALKPVAQKADRPCLGKHQDLRTPECQICLLKTECAALMGPESTGTRLSEYRWRFLPAAWEKRITSTRALEDAYYTTHQTVFGRPPKDRLDRFRDPAAEMARQVPCSFRLYLLTCMIAWKEREESLLDSAEKVLAAPFKPRVLTEKTALEWAKRYLRLCRKTYGSEDLSSLDKIIDGHYCEADLHRRFLASETAAGQFIVAWKLKHEGLPWVPLYGKLETSLDPDWLAVEETYEPIVEKPNRCPFRATVWRRYSFLKKHPRAAIAVFRCREDIFPQAVDNVLSDYGLKPAQFFLHEEVTETPLMVWLWLGQAIQHLEMTRAQTGLPSQFSSLVERLET